MSIRGRVHVGEDGTLRISLPGFAGKDVEYTIDLPTAGKNGTNGAHVRPGEGLSKTGLSQEAWQRFVDGLEGTIDDPTFVRPPQGEYETRERLD